MLFRSIAQVQSAPPEPQLEFEVVEHVTVGDAHSFKFTKPYSSFDELNSGELIAQDCTRQYLAPSQAGFSVLMPGDQGAINRGTVPEAYYLIRAI